MDIMELVVSINKVLWGPFMLFLLLGTGVYFSFRMRFIQVRRVRLAVKQTFGFLFEKEKSRKNYKDLWVRGWSETPLEILGQND